VSTIFGACLLMTGTVLHPNKAEPIGSAEAFARYASDDAWVASHLSQLLGVLLVVGGLVAVYGLIARRSSRSVARLGMAGAIASAGVFTALHAVDGIALKRMVDAWVAAPAAEKAAVFHATEAVRQIVIGLASLSALLFGVTIVLYGAAIVMSNVFPKWLGWIAVAGGVGMAVTGLSGISAGSLPLASSIGMPSTVLLTAWLLMMGSLMWRRSGVI